MDNTEDVESEDDFDYYYNSDPYDYDDNESPEVNEGTDKDEESNIELEEEKEIEFARKNYAKAVDGMQVALETEAKAKVELSRIKKKLEADVLDLSHLEHANASNTEALFFLMRDSSILALVSVSRATCMPSMALA